MSRIIINGDRAHVPTDTAGSWWLDATPEQFYATVKARQPMLALKFGSEPVLIRGQMELSLPERAKRLTRDKGRAY